MSQYSGRSQVAKLVVVAALLHTIHAFNIANISTRIPLVSSSTSLYMGAMNRRNKAADLAAKMAEAKKQRELAETEGGETTIEDESNDSSSKNLSAAEIKLRNDRQRFADMLDNSMSGGGGIDKGYYLTEQQENENADAVFRGVTRIYEGDPAPTEPFGGLINIETGEALGKGGASRLIPWEGSRSSTSGDYLVCITDPRPKSTELRTALKRLSGALTADTLKKCLVINSDTPGENRRFLKKSFGGEDTNNIRILCDEKLDWMREYTALGEKRYSITMFVLREGRVEKLAREVEAELLPQIVKNAIKSLN